MLISNTGFICLITGRNLTRNRLRRSPSEFLSSLSGQLLGALIQGVTIVAPTQAHRIRWRLANSSRCSHSCRFSTGLRLAVFHHTRVLDAGPWSGVAVIFPKRQMLLLLPTDRE